MDSLTQIALGAAVAEVTLGKKIGNKSILWGAIAGTIPDLDVLANGFMSPLDALSFHRGISHSFLFSILAAAGLGPLVDWIYQSKWHHRIAFSCWAFLFLGIGIPILFSSMGLVVKLIAFAMIVIIIYSFYKKISRALSSNHISNSLGLDKVVFFDDCDTSHFRHIYDLWYTAVSALLICKGRL